MKNPFKSPPPPKKKFRKSPLPDTLDKALERELIKRARKDPEWAFAAAKQKFGLMLPEETEDPLERAEKDTLTELYASDPDFREQVKNNYLKNSSTLEERIEELAIQEIESNPEIKKKAIRGRVDAMLDNGNSTDPVLGMLTTLRSYRLLQDELGGGEKKDEGFFNPAVLLEVIKILPAVLGQKGNSSPRIYVVETPEGIVELDAVEYKRYLEQKRLPTPMVEEQKSIEAPKTPTPEKVSLHISSWLTYLDKPPQDFVEDLTAGAEQGDAEASVALAFLKKNTLEDVVKFLEANADHPELGEAIRAVLAHPDWIKDVVRMVQEVA